MFSAPETNYNRLTNLGITTCLPHTRVLTCLRNDALRHYHAAMASVHRAITNKQLKLLHNQQLCVDTHTFSQRCTFKWARH
eukprot:12172187-Karenia_brevis.AAC.1